MAQIGHFRSCEDRTAVVKKTCIIGAGACGLVAAKVLRSRGLPYDCFELGSQLGGLWRYENDNGVSGIYQSLHINSSRREMAFSDFPMPSHFPDFPHHSQIIAYFESYADHFGLTPGIQFRSRVEHVRPVKDGYEVRVSQERGVKVETYGSLIVANGHHWCPRIPELPGAFEGLSLHSHDYRTPDILRGKRVLVMGIGNSGCDIACEAARVAARVCLSTRRGAHIIPKYVFGKPLDRICPPALWRYLPFRLLQRIFSVSLRLARGRLSRFGLPVPDHKFLEEHPTVSSDLLNLLGHGKLSVKPNVAELCGESIRFADGSSEAFDVLIYATGYKIKFPFFEPDIVPVEQNDVRLYRHVIHPAHANMYFVGLVQPWGPLMPLAEAQAEWIADLLTGHAVLPPAATMLRQIASDLDRMRRRYTSSPRHTIQVDFHPYLALLRRERSLGQKLATKQRPLGSATSEPTALDSISKAA